jgi:hypothetical protein
MMRRLVGRICICKVCDDARAFGGVWAFGVWQMPKVLVEFIFS